MDGIKTYEQINKNDDSLSFKISRIEDYYEKRNGRVDEPHRHNFFTVILTKKAKGKHYIDFKAYSFSDNQVVFVSPGQVHQLIEEEKPYGYYLLFSNDFLMNNHISLSFIADLNLFNASSYAPPLTLNEGRMNKLSEICEQIITYNNADNKYKMQAIGALLKLFLIQCNTSCSLSECGTPKADASSTILRKFKEAVEVNYKQWHATGQYADHLNITADHLNRTVKSLSGKTTKEYILARICISAKRMLYFSDLSAKEIGFEHGFSEASNFSSFFKKQAKMSPSEFRSNR